MTEIFYISELEIFDNMHHRVMSRNCEFSPPDHWLGTLDSKRKTFFWSAHDGLTSDELRELADFMDEFFEGGPNG